MTGGDTELGKRFIKPENVQTGNSGVYLISAPREAFQIRNALITHAEATIDLQYYLWKQDTTGRLILQRILEAADRGVRVRILLDDLPHVDRDAEHARIAAHPNIEFRLYNPINARGVLRKPYFLLAGKRLNHRMHNKLIAVDGCTAILGGRNLGDDYFGVDPALNFHDLDAFLTGPVTDEISSSFEQYWNASNAIPIEAMYHIRNKPAAHRRFRSRLEANLQHILKNTPASLTPEYATTTQLLSDLANKLTWAPVEILTDPPNRYHETESSVIHKRLLALKEEAESEILIHTPYLLPSDQTIRAFHTLTEQGVRVRIMTNSLMSNNHIAVHAHYKHERPRLLDAGVELYELKAKDELLDYYRKTNTQLADSNSGLHTKAYVIDGRTSVISSYNMDPRSRYWNTETAVIIHGEAVGRQLQGTLETALCPENAYRLERTPKGRLYWVQDFEPQAETHAFEPDAPLIRRSLALVLAYLPVYNLL